MSMKKIFAILAALGFLVLGAQAAQAFSTEQQNGVNPDGTAKFADPDEQMPNFVVGPGDNAGTAPSASIMDGNPVTIPTYGESDPGAAAFNQAFDRLQNNR
jgi:hypothetical protein